MLDQGAARESATTLRRAAGSPHGGWRRPRTRKLLASLAQAAGARGAKPDRIWRTRERRSSGGSAGVQERALLGVAQESRAGDGADGIERERVVLELGRQRVQLLRRGVGLVRDRLVQPRAEVCGKHAPPLHRGLVHCVRPDLGDHVRVAFTGKSVDDLPALPRGPHAERADCEPAEEERHRKLGANLRGDE